MQSKIELALTFDDVTLVPQYSEVMSRSDVDITTFITKNPNIKLDIPIIASPMKTVTEDIMAQKLSDLGGIGFIHRFHPGLTVDESIQQQAKQIGKINGKVGFAIGVSEDWRTRVEACLEAGGDVVMVDIAHGNHLHQVNLIREFKKYYPEIPIIAANVAEEDGVRRLCDLGVNGIRVSIGPGSLCTTRVMTGFGIPSITSLMNCRKVVREEGYDVTLFQDGGIRNPSDLVKSIAAGADAVIIGGLFSGCSETPGDPTFNSYTGTFEKKYMGSASEGNKGNRRFVEGAEKPVPVKGSITEIVRTLTDGLRSGLSYGGSHNLEEFRRKAQFVQVTANGLREGHPHMFFK